VYLASSQTNTEQHLTVIFCGSDRLLQILLQFVFWVYGRRSVLRSFNRKLYGHGIQSYLLCVLSIALSVASVPTASYSVARACTLSYLLS